MRKVKVLEHKDLTSFERPEKFGPEEFGQKNVY